MPLGFADVVDRPMFGSRPFRWRMGTRPLVANDWLEIDDARAADLALKEALVRDRPDHVIGWLPGSHDPATELAGLVSTALEGEGLTMATPGDHPIDRCGRSVQEDLCLLERKDTGWILTAGSVCFPTRWDFPSKLGRTLPEIHEPVPDYATAIGAAVDRFFDRMAPGDLAWRLNWSLVDDAARRLEPDRRQVSAVMPDDPATGLFFRVERQTLRRLDHHRAIVFGIRIHGWPLGEVVAHLPPAAFARQLASMPGPVARYKNLTTLRAPLIEWLAHR